MKSKFSINKIIKIVKEHESGLSAISFQQVNIQLFGMVMIQIINELVQEYIYTDYKLQLKFLQGRC